MGVIDEIKQLGARLGHERDLLTEKVTDRIALLADSESNESFAIMRRLDPIVSAGPITIVTLNNPEMRNAFLDDMHTGMQEIWQHLAADRSVRAVVLTGAGKASMGRCPHGSGDDPAAPAPPRVSSGSRASQV